MRKMIKVIIFDYFGVFTHPGTFDRIIKTYADRYGIDVKKFLRVRRELWDKARVSKITEDQFWELLVQKLNIPLKPEEMRLEWYASFKPINETFEVALKLKKNYKIVLISNTIPEWFEFWKKKYSLGEVFDVIFVSY